MKLLRENHLPTGWFTTRMRKGHDLTIVVKGTYRLVRDGRAELLDADEQRPITGDEHVEDDPKQSLRYSSDCEPLKAHADLLLVGNCHPPGGKPVFACPVTFRVGQHERNLAVRGDRVWQRTLTGSWEASEPRPFVSMPLTYERAFGGPGFALNPAGVGFGEGNTALPNIEDPRQPVRAPNKSYHPAGFAPLDRRWGLRAAKTGTFDETWKEKFWPGMPQDFDKSYFNAAPNEMQVKGFLRGDESVFLRNLHPEHPEFSSQLPGVRPRAILKARRESGTKLHELPLDLDTLWVDAAAGIVVLVWRGIIRVRAPELDGLEALYVPLVDINQEPVHPSDYTDRVEELLAAPVAPEMPEPEILEPEDADDALAAADGAEIPDAEPPDPELEANLAAIAKQNEESMAASRAKAEQNLPPEAIKALDAGDMDTFADVVLEDAGTTRAAADKLVKDELDKARALASAQGLDPRLVSTFGQEEEEPVPKPPKGQALTRAEVERRLQAGESLAGENLSDLDLRGLAFDGLDLTGCDFTQSNLTQCSLTEASLQDANLVKTCLSQAQLVETDLNHARLHSVALDDAVLTGALLDEALLSRCDLTNAVLRGASLCKTVFRECRLDGTQFDTADLTAAQLAAADLRKSSLASAKLNDANLEAALIGSAPAAAASFRGANLAGAFFDHGALEGTDFSGATLDEARFAHANLAAATFSDANGEKVIFDGAAIDGLRAGAGCNLPGLSAKQVTGRGPTFSEANLRGADFRYSQIQAALFVGANLSGSDLSAADMRGANLTKANLADARLRMADLFGASFERADLSRTDLRGSSCFRAEFLDATLDNTAMGQTNLKGTQLYKMSKEL